MIGGIMRAQWGSYPPTLSKLGLTYQFVFLLVFLLVILLSFAPGSLQACRVTKLGAKMRRLLLLFALIFDHGGDTICTQLRQNLIT